MGRKPRATDKTLAELFLDMLAAERGASANTLDAYRRDLTDFSTDLGKAGGGIATADTEMTTLVQRCQLMWRFGLRTVVSLGFREAGQFSC